MRIILSQPPWAGGAIAVHFGYDPLLVSAIRGVPGRKWVQSQKAWTIPSTPEALTSLRSRVPSEYQIQMSDVVAARMSRRQQALEQATALKAAGDSKIDFTFRTEPYAHQRAGLDFLLTLGSGALLWEMGTGKTKTAIDYCEYLALRGPLRVLVICPNTVRRNWATEIEKHAGHRDYVVPEGSTVVRARVVGSARYTVLNCEALSLKATADAVLARTWDVVIVDESTRFKTPSAKRTKTLHKIKSQRRLILTGSPITGKSQDAWSQLEFVEPGVFGSWWSFIDRYFEKDRFGGIKAPRPSVYAELRERIESRSYRVLKSQVLDLPPKVYEDRWVELSGTQAKAYEQMKKELRVQVAGVHAISASTILTQLLRLTQITAGLIGAGTDYTWLDDNAKVTELDSLLREELEDRQVVIFGLYQRELEKLWLRYAPPSVGSDEWDQPAILYGPTPERRRHELIEQFQSGRRQYLFAQAHTGGIGINLTAAQYAVYYTRGWSLEDYLQSQDRLHRIGQQGTVTIVHLGARGTVDEQIAKALAAKQNMADLLTGDRARRLAAEVLA